MKLWAEEKKLGTVEILMTLPLRDYEVVIGKFLASFALLTVTVFLSLVLPLSVMYLGNPDGGTLIGGYIGSPAHGGVPTYPLDFSPQH